MIGERVCFRRQAKTERTEPDSDHTFQPAPQTQI